jgi:Ala-tRNA(Pro) deacylase
MKDEIFELLKELDIPYRYIEHKAVFTVEEAMGEIADKRPIKNLLLKEDKGERLVLVIMDGEQKLDAKSLAKTLGIKKLQFAKPEVLKKTFGVEPGAVSLFGILHDTAKRVEVVVDETLVIEPEIGFHPNENTSTIFVPGIAIEKIIQKTGHSYRIMKLYDT